LNKYVIITGGGSGSRMQQALPKQFLEISGVPVLFYTITAFLAYQPDINIILTLPEKHIQYWNELVLQKHFKVNHRVIAGGTTRYQSVKNGLAFVPKDSLVAIHDAVRPFVSSEVIATSFSDAEKLGNAVPVIPIVDSLRMINRTENRPLNRDEVFAVQTPQTFLSTALIEAYNAPESPLFTDDASVLEQNGIPIHIINGNTENIKITRPSDLMLAETFVKHLVHHPSFPQISAFER
jgi:2-C-methyl-D-erythritol 4-phosphate cytidylyltransferase